LPSFAIIEKFRAMKKFIIILIIFSFLGFQINGCAFFSQTENREAVGAASGGVLGFVIGGNALGAIIGALSGTLVAPAIGYFYDKKIAPRKKDAEKYKLREIINSTSKCGKWFSSRDKYSIYSSCTY
jgi:hypothetical protein